MIARVKNVLNYFLRDQRIPEACSCKYLGIIICRYLRWDDKGTQYIKPGRHFIS
jgi:hypothetical protein